MVALFALYALLILFGVLVIFWISNSWFHSRKERSREKAFADAFQEALFRHRLAVDHSEIIGNRVMVLDKKSNRMLFLDFTGARAQEECIPLYHISDAEIVEERTGNGGICRMLLHLRHKAGGNLFRFCFFDKDVDPITDLPRVARLIRHWKLRLDVHRENLRPHLIRE